MIRFDLFSIGHSNLVADRFAAMLRAAGADAVADVSGSCGLKTQRATSSPLDRTSE
jgi:hypothetical protein